ncbi:MAG: nicotinate phosphoribosyltransferase [Anaerolineae bacterium]
MKKQDRQLAEGFLFTDMYQLTMAQLYYRQGVHEKRAQFDHFFRNYPDYGTHTAGYCINAGLEWLVDWMRETHVTAEDVAFLRAQKGNSGRSLFEEDFLAWLADNGHFESITMHAIPEGRVIHPNVPLTVVQGPLAVAQILETPLLNQLNYQILIATKAAQVREAGRGQLMLEFGLRRGPASGAHAGARAALIGGADFTSNVGVSAVLGFPPKGTHAHSMVQVFMALGGSELDAFRAYAELYPDDCLLLVDTINTLESGVPNAIKVFEELRAKGHKPIGVRLDSGDLAYLSIQVARMLDAAGFEDTVIVLSNQLDEITIWQIVTQIQEEAQRYDVDVDRLLRRLVYGVGTRLITSAGNSALDGVYKLVAMCDEGEWRPAIKISDTPDKIPNPGHKQVWRVYGADGKATADLMSLDDEDPRAEDVLVLRHPSSFHKSRELRRDEISLIEPLLVPILEEGRLVYAFPEIEAIRARRRSDVSRLYAGVRRLLRPHIYHVSLTQRLWEYKQSLIESFRR